MGIYLPLHIKMKSNSEELIIEKKNGYLCITLNNVNSLNAFTTNMKIRITELLNSASEANDINSILITGNGKFHSSGVDLKEMANDFYNIKTDENNNITYELIHE